jgi:hypothetical protein
MKTKETRIQCLHPQGKHAPTMNADTYYLFEKAILESLKITNGLTFYQIVDNVKRYFKKNKINFNGSVDWFCISVKNHLEATGAIEVFTEKNKKMNTLKKIESPVKI